MQNQIADIFILVVFESGEEAEDLVEKNAAVSHDAIEDHEAAADITYWLVLLLDVGGVVGLDNKQQTSQVVQTFYVRYADICTAGNRFINLHRKYGR